MTDAGRQTVGGVVVNVRPDVGRREDERLTAALHDAAHDGPATSTPPSCGAGSPGSRRCTRGRGAGLARRFARVAWPAPG